ncbi:MAG: hypothetical protein E6Q97_09785 [Desulfurellales bacterium]|nr:MAG: hypothetical protein E6Q97_09785 [Desulfurellales bacterium]
MHILAIDPGTEQSGYAVLHGDSILCGGTERNEEILQRIDSGEYDLLVVEEITYCHRGGFEIMRTAWWGGAFCMRAHMRRRDYALIARNIVKELLLGRTWGSDAEVTRSLKALYGETGKRGGLGGLKGHEIAALAAGIAYRISEKASMFSAAPPSTDKRKRREKPSRKKKRKSL